jgi:hypothetical protein
VKAAIADLQSCKKALRDELLNRSVPQVEGAQFGAVITQSVRWTLDTKAVKAEMGEAWYDWHSFRSQREGGQIDGLQDIFARPGGRRALPTPSR